MLESIAVYLNAQGISAHYTRVYVEAFVGDAVRIRSMREARALVK